MASVLGAAPASSCPSPRRSRTCCGKPGGRHIGNFVSTNDGGNGSSCIDLLNLRHYRTPVLVEGHRFVHSAYGSGDDCVDLASIPIQMVDRIEILKDGASTIDGAQAVAQAVRVRMIR